MFFPHNIDSQIKMTKKASKKDKTSIILFFLSMLVVVLFMFFRSFIRLPVFISLLLAILVGGAIGVLILRTFIFKEKDLLDEEESSKDDSLERYYNIIESELPNMIDGIEVFENTDGNMCVCIEVLFGPNDRAKSQRTLSFLAEIFGIISRFSIDFKAYVTREDFLRSIECKRFLNTINSVKDKNLAPVISEMGDLILSYTELHSNLYSTFLVIRFSPVNMINLPSLRDNILETLNSSGSSVRNVQFCDRLRFRSFIREYNRVEALDLSSFKGGKLTSKLVRKYRRHVFVVEKNNIGYSFKTGVKEL